MRCRQACNCWSVSSKPLPRECAGDIVKLNGATENPSLSDKGGSFFQDFGKDTYLKNKLRTVSCEQKYFFPLLLPISFEIQGNALRRSDPLRLEGCLLWVTWNKWKTNRKLAWGITSSKDHRTLGELACQTQNCLLLSCWTVERGQYLRQSHMVMVLEFTSLLPLIKHQLLCQYGPKPNISSITGKLVIPFADSQACLAEGLSSVVCRTPDPFNPCVNTMVCRGVSMSKRGLFHKGVKLSSF